MAEALTRPFHALIGVAAACLSTACAVQPCSAADVVPILFKRKLDLHQLTFALGEAIAHLHGLWFDGKLERIAGADGVFRFAPA